MWPDCVEFDVHDSYVLKCFLLSTGISKSVEVRLFSDLSQPVGKAENAA